MHVIKHSCSQFTFTPLVFLSYRISTLTDKKLCIFFRNREQSALPKVRQQALEMSLNALSHCGDSPSRTSCFSQDFFPFPKARLHLCHWEFLHHSKMQTVSSLINQLQGGEEKGSENKNNNKKPFLKRLFLKIEYLGKARCSLWAKED